VRSPFSQACIDDGLYPARRIVRRGSNEHERLLRFTSKVRRRLANEVEKATLLLGKLSKEEEAAAVLAAIEKLVVHGVTRHYN
jgi:hypothetical protein